jgi:hypothetical protein
VTVGRMTWFLSTVVTTGQRGPNGSDGREDSEVPGHGSDDWEDDAVSERSGDGRAAWTWWR